MAKHYIINRSHDSFLVYDQGNPLRSWVFETTAQLITFCDAEITDDDLVTLTGAADLLIGELREGK